MIKLNNCILPDNTNAIKLEPASILNKAIVGYEKKYDFLIYDVNILIECFMEQGMTKEEAWEWFNYNTLGTIVSNYPRFIYE